MIIPEIIWGAIRQYRHNNGDDGFVFAFEQEETTKVVVELQGRVKELEEGLRECLSELVYAYRGLYPNKEFSIENEKWYTLLPKEKQDDRA